MSSGSRVIIFCQSSMIDKIPVCPFKLFLMLGATTIFSHPFQSPLCEPCMLLLSVGTCTVLREAAVSSAYCAVQRCMVMMLIMKCLFCSLLLLHREPIQRGQSALKPYVHFESVPLSLLTLFGFTIFCGVCSLYA